MYSDGFLKVTALCLPVHYTLEDTRLMTGQYIKPTAKQAAAAESKPQPTDSVAPPAQY